MKNMGDGTASCGRNTRNVDIGGLESHIFHQLNLKITYSNQKKANFQFDKQ